MTPNATDEGNHILGCQVGPIADPTGLAAAISAITGVVEHGLCLGLADTAIVAGLTVSLRSTADTATLV